jgi:2-phospho-L-lactate/phosphoenolpyruvate guanylyltransferase
MAQPRLCLAIVTPYVARQPEHRPDDEIASSRADASQVARSSLMSSPPAHPTAWTLLIPVKQTTIAKSRLSGIEATTRQRLAVAFAQDTAAAALACPDVRRVVVVTNDPAGRLLEAQGVDVTPDVPDRGLNEALLYAAEQVRRAGDASPIAALSSDLPALRPHDLSTAFRATAAPRWFVPDLAGDGTTMLAAAAGEEWLPHFGHDSRATHRALGMAEVALPGLERLRRDVDTMSDLSDASRRGVGRHTALVLAYLDSFDAYDELRLA